MTNEEKQALIDWLEEGLMCSAEYGFSGNSIKAMQIALTALTAQPIKLEPIIQIGYTHDEITCMCNIRNDDIKAIRAAGYEVQE